MVTRVIVSIALCASVCLPAATSKAQASAEPSAQELFELGSRLSSEERWVEARDAFARSAARTPRASTYYNLAVCSLASGLARAALGALAQFDARVDRTTQGEQVKLAAALRAEALARVGTLVLSVSPADAQVEVDGEPESRSEGAERIVWLDPGTHRVRVSRAEHAPAMFEVSVTARGTEHRRVELAADAAAKASEAAVGPAAADLRVRAQPPVTRPQPAAAPAQPLHAQAETPSLFARPLTWIVIGVIAASATTITLVATHGSGGSDKDPYAGSAGFTL